MARLVLTDTSPLIGLARVSGLDWLLRSDFRIGRGVVEAVLVRVDGREPE